MGRYFKEDNLPINVKDYDDNTNRRVIQLTLSGEFVNEFRSEVDAQKATGIHASGIGAACKGKYKFAGGYKWKFVNPD